MTGIIDGVNDNIYNISWFMNYGDGTSKDEIEYVIAWAAFQTRGSVKYAREFGGSFKNLEQSSSSDLIQKTTLFQVNMVNSIYAVNRSRNFNPFIVMGGDYIIAKQDKTKLNVLVLWILQQDITKIGITKINGGLSQQAA